jgi:spermidine synthase
VQVELATALIGGVQAPLVDLAYGHSAYGSVFLYAILLLVGTLVGLEIPLLMRILKDEMDFKDVVGKVLTFDYLGALVGSLMFALVMVPMLGTARTSFLFGILNALAGLVALWVLRDKIGRAGSVRLAVQGVGLVVLLGAGVFAAERIARFGEQGVYPGHIVYTEQTPYQRIVITSDANAFQLWLNGNLQFHSADEYRYHEALVHPAMAVARRRAQVLVLGGGDGLAVREVLRYPDVARITVVDLDPAMTRLAKRNPTLRALNRGALSDRRVRVVNDDAMVWLDEGRRGPYDVVIADFPDPSDFALGKLYTTRFFALLRTALASHGVLAMQSTSPLGARTSFWCIEHTMRASGLTTRPYHATVPSFGEWGYVLASEEREIPMPRQLAVEGLQFLDDEMLPSLFTFPRDMTRVETEVNRLQNQILVHYYSREWQ